MAPTDRSSPLVFDLGISSELIPNEAGDAGGENAAHPLPLQPTEITSSVEDDVHMASVDSDEELPPTMATPSQEPLLATPTPLGSTHDPFYPDVGPIHYDGDSDPCSVEWRKTWRMLLLCTSSNNLDPEHFHWSRFERDKFKQRLLLLYALYTGERTN